VAAASFDVSTGADLQEVDNAVNQTVKEVSQRYDFKGTHCTIAFDRAGAAIRLHADDEFRMQQLLDILQARLARRGVPLRNVGWGENIPGAGQAVRREVTLTQGIPADTAKRIVRAIKDEGFRKVSASIQGDEIRVGSPSKDALQAVITFLRGQDFGIELRFGNYRG
jgi:cyclic-di-GMP-binding protein